MNALILQLIFLLEKIKVHICDISNSHLIKKITFINDKSRKYL